MHEIRIKHHGRRMTLRPDTRIVSDIGSRLKHPDTDLISEPDPASRSVQITGSVSVVMIRSENRISLLHHDLSPAQKIRRTSSFSDDPP